MRCAAHVDAVAEAFVTQTAHFQCRSVLAIAKLGINPQILADYTQICGKNMHYQQWITWAQGAKRLVIHTTNAPSSVTQASPQLAAYASAAYFSASRLLVGQTFPAADVADLAKVGIECISMTGGAASLNTGDNPISVISLKHKGKMDFSIVDNYFKADEEIVVYDKYIDDNCLSLISHIAATAPNLKRLKIYTTNISSDCHTPAHILTTLNLCKIPGLIVTCQLTSVKFRQRAHDRYIFLGKRLLMSFSAGLGQFGALNAQGVRVNKMSSINIYDLSDSNENLEFELSNNSKFSLRFIPEGML